jgi:hypothetical protein
MSVAFVAVCAAAVPASGESISWEGTITVSDSYQHVYLLDAGGCVGASEVTLSTTYSLARQTDTSAGPLPSLNAVMAASGESGSAHGTGTCTFPNGGCGVTTKTETVTGGAVVFSNQSPAFRSTLVYFPAERKLAMVPLDGTRQVALPENSYLATSTGTLPICSGSRTRPGSLFGSVGGPRFENTDEADFRLPVEVDGATLRVRGTFSFSATGGSAAVAWNGLPIGNYGNFSVLHESGTVTNVANEETVTVDLRGSLGYELTVALDGSGDGAVTSSPPGIACGVLCRADFAAGSNVTLTPDAEDGSRFVRWEGACAGSLGCVVTMDQSKSVTAIFEAVDGSITVEAQTVPPNSAATFAFQGALQGTLGPGGQLTREVAAGVYTVTETPVTDGWSVARIDCSDDDSISDATARTATFHVDEGEHVTCVFTNDRNEPPIAVNDDITQDFEWSRFDQRSFIVDVLANDYDPDGDPLRVIRVEPAPSGASVFLTNPDTGEIQISPTSQGWFGVVRFSYWIEDPHGAQGQATATIRVRECRDVDVTAGMDGFAATASAGITFCYDGEQAQRTDYRSDTNLAAGLDAWNFIALFAPFAPSFQLVTDQFFPPIQAVRYQTCFDLPGTTTLRALRRLRAALVAERGALRGNVIYRTIVAAIEQGLPSICFNEYSSWIAVTFEPDGGFTAHARVIDVGGNRRSDPSDVDVTIRADANRVINPNLRPRPFDGDETWDGRLALDVLVRCPDARICSAPRVIG